MTHSIALIDYGSGNLYSAAKALEHVNVESELNYSINVTSNVNDVKRADKIILPGQGAFRDCMKFLQAVPEMIQVLEEQVLEKNKPFLGICVGMQLLADSGVEYGKTPGLGWIPGEVIPIKPDDPGLKIPHMGWNEIVYDQPDHFLLRNKKTSQVRDDHFYFVHSFMFQLKDRQHLLAHTDYGGEVTAVIGRANIAGIQCHPEKSQNAGLDFIRNFLRWEP